MSAPDPTPPAGDPDRAALARLSGLELLRRMAGGAVPGPSIARTIPFAPVTVEHGHVVFAAEPDDRVLNPLGGVHGGYAATLLDSAMGCAVHSTLPPGAGYATASLHLHYVRGLTPRSGPLLAEGRVVHAGRAVVTAEGRLVGRDDSVLYAHGSATCLVQSGPAQSGPAPGADRGAPGGERQRVSSPASTTSEVPVT